MDNFECINIKQAEQLIADGAIIADIRDQQSYQQNHITDAIHLSNENLHTFIQEADLDAPLIVCCYHGFSSQSAAGILIQQGFEQVYSLDGGFEMWQATRPDQCSSS
ncbi:thiosulfate sulfurtransferase GlpE [Amphritea balenae]|uniref:Thiosulfate sulfurtransferase GlpE n=1 Tax=Amphritea balenae TaxID=452629 RepID=A0A3P1SPW4_9GAMM|nr:thiosulfate sulfurtransferase GlpE [Amphritea balenae]RRC99167.1 thiosulfate sulfurtransferase GlpE [Amphritea balenae]GGK73368.1 thiosulfate sulfurtransferase GlpE [Amphritea balenae]